VPSGQPLPVRAEPQPYAVGNSVQFLLFVEGEFGHRAGCSGAARPGGDQPASQDEAREEEPYPATHSGTPAAEQSVHPPAAAMTPSLIQHATAAAGRVQRWVRPGQALFRCTRAGASAKNLVAIFRWAYYARATCFRSFLSVISSSAWTGELCTIAEKIREIRRHKRGGAGSERTIKSPLLYRLSYASNYGSSACFSNLRSGTGKDFQHWYYRDSHGRGQAPTWASAMAAISAAGPLRAASPVD
jgi:hypothetical protein